jgi:hypothetical protein
MRAALGISISVLAAAALFVTSSTVTAAVVRLLDDDAVRAAIDWGIHGDPQPYFVDNVHPSLRTGEYSPVIAAIYTPYVRVATAAAIAKQHGHQLDVLDITPEMRAAVFHVVYRWPRKEDGPPTSPYTLAQQDHEAWVRKMRTATPFWQTRDPGEWQGLVNIGVAIPFSDPVLIAAYPMSEMVAGQHLIIYHDLDPDFVPGAIPASLMQIGWVSETDIQSWK